MDRLFRIDFYPQEWLVKTAGLTPDECGMYIQICAMIYSKRGPIPNDPEELSRKLKKCSIRLARSLIERLAEKEKIYIRDGKIGQERAELELNLKRSHLETSANGGRTKAENARDPNKVNDLTSTGHPIPVATTTPTLSPTAKDKGSKNRDVVPVSEASAPEMGMAVSLYNAVAKRHGLPICQRLTDARKSKMRARLKDAGGLEGWRAAIDILDTSPFLTGHGEKGWKADIDFVLQETSFTRIIEGYYSQRKKTNEATQRNNAQPTQTERIAAAVERSARAHGLLDPEQE